MCDNQQAEDVLPTLSDRYEGMREIKQQLAEQDADVLIGLLDISSEDLLERFSDYVCHYVRENYYED